MVITKKQLLEIKRKINEFKEGSLSVNDIQRWIASSIAKNVFKDTLLEENLAQLSSEINLNETLLYEKSKKVNQENLIALCSKFMNELLEKIDTLLKNEGKT